jgi:DNA transposition AAA+ family ATPase
MSSPEFAGLQGISGTAVAKRCALLASPVKRQLLWFIQGLSLLEGGCKTLAIELLKMFPERVGTHRMHELGMAKNQRYTGQEAVAIKDEFIHGGDCADELLRRGRGDTSEFLDETWDGVPVTAPVDYGPPVPWQNLYAKCFEAAKAWLSDFLTELCINPNLQFNAPGEADGDAYRMAYVDYFQDIIGALFEYKCRYEEQVRAEFCHTAISRRMWKQLDDALKSRTMIVLDGLEGRGKTEAIRAWCNCHLGVARFLSLKGTNTKTAHFREFARALGVGHASSYKVYQMQANIEEVLQTSHLMLVIDEAHYLFNQGPRMQTRPEMLDYIDTALCNPPSPVALVTTPQFMICMERAARQVEWNYKQFKRRCKRYCRLPAKNTAEDIEAIARHLLPGADKATIEQVLAYEALSKRDLSAVGDIVREAKLLAEEEGAKKVTFEHVKRAIHEVLFVSDVPWAEMEKRLRDKKLEHKALRHSPSIAPEPAPEDVPEPAETRGRDISPRLAPSAPRGNRMRLQEPVSALIREPDEAILTPG